MKSRMVINFGIAEMLIHEVAHACWASIRDNFKDMGNQEPFFENEPLCELGWSLEDKLWGGYPKDIVHSEIWDGGTGLPPMGNIATKWFTMRGENYNTEPIVLDHVMGEVPAVSDEELQKIPYYCYDHWPIPLTYHCNMFQASFWNLNFRMFGPIVTRFGPLTRGTRLLAGDDDLADSYKLIQRAVLDNPNYFVQLEIKADMTEEQAAWVTSENGRRMHALGILQALEKNMISEADKVYLDTFRKMDVEDNNWEGESDEDEDPEPKPNCPRWEEIVGYVLRNRGPLELAWDTMNFEIPEPTLYRYIMKRGGLKITPMEWRAFLRVANYRGELFA